MLQNFFLVMTVSGIETPHSTLWWGSSNHSKRFKSSDITASGRYLGFPFTTDDYVSRGESVEKWKSDVFVDIM